MGDCINALEPHLSASPPKVWLKTTRAAASTHGRSPPLHGSVRSRYLGRMGLKVYTSFRPKARFMVLLYDSGNGDLLAMIGGG